MTRKIYDLTIPAGTYTDKNGQTKTKWENVGAVFHYLPLHTAPAGKKYGRFHGDDIYTTRESERILRLPLYYSMGEETVNKIVINVDEYYEDK